MHGLILLALVTLLYAGYNLFVKMSSGHVADKVTSTVLATMCLQFTALVVSTLFAIYLLRKGGQVLQLSPSAYGWAAAAGLCIGAAEIGYFYLFGSFRAGKSIPASVVIPTVVCGTVIVALLASRFLFNETLTLVQISGIVIAIVGIVMVYAGRTA